MAIIQPTNNTAPVFYPEGDYTVVKYLDLTKFISLLQRQSLFFCRVDKLEDKYEGTTSISNFDLRVKWKKYLRDDAKIFTVPLSDDDIIADVKKDYELQKQFKGINCVNCWNRGEIESAALWKIYSDFNKGIMIMSSISRLVKGLESTTEEIKLSEVHYLDYEKEPMPDGNTTYPFLHKQKSYSYEDEVRLIHEVDSVGWKHDWSKEEVEEGIFIKADLSIIINEIIVSPHAPNWFYKLVEDLVAKYGLNKTIKKSKLSIVE